MPETKYPRTRLAYIQGYGFCLYTTDKKHPLNLEGDGEINDDKQLLRETFNGLVDKRTKLEAHQLRGESKIKEFRAEISQRETQVKNLLAKIRIDAETIQMMVDMATKRDAKVEQLEDQLAKEAD